MIFKKMTSIFVFMALLFIMQCNGLALSFKPVDAPVGKPPVQAVKPPVKIKTSDGKEVTIHSPGKSNVINITGINVKKVESTSQVKSIDVGMPVSIKSMEKSGVTIRTSNPISFNGLPISKTEPIKQVSPINMQSKSIVKSINNSGVKVIPSLKKPLLLKADDFASSESLVPVEFSVNQKPSVRTSSIEEDTFTLMTPSLRNFFQKLNPFQQKTELQLKINALKSQMSTMATKYQRFPELERSFGFTREALHEIISMNKLEKPRTNEEITRLIQKDTMPFIQKMLPLKDPNGVIHPVRVKISSQEEMRRYDRNGNCISESWGCIYRNQEEKVIHINIELLKNGSEQSVFFVLAHEYRHLYQDIHQKYVARDVYRTMESVFPIDNTNRYMQYIFSKEEMDADWFAFSLLNDLDIFKVKHPAVGSASDYRSVYSLEKTKAVELSSNNRSEMFSTFRKNTDSDEMADFFIHLENDWKTYFEQMPLEKQSRYLSVMANVGDAYQIGFQHGEVAFVTLLQRTLRSDPILNQLYPNKTSSYLKQLYLEMTLAKRLGSTEFIRFIQELPPQVQRLFFQNEQALSEIIRIKTGESISVNDVEFLSKLNGPLMESIFQKNIRLIYNKDMYRAAGVTQIIGTTLERNLASSSNVSIIEKLISPIELFDGNMKKTIERFKQEAKTFQQMIQSNGDVERSILFDHFAKYTEQFGSSEERLFVEIMKNNETVKHSFIRYSVIQ